MYRITCIHIHSFVSRFTSFFFPYPLLSNSVVSSCLILLLFFLIDTISIPNYFYSVLIISQRQHFVMTWAFNSNSNGNISNVSRFINQVNQNYSNCFFCIFKTHFKQKKETDKDREKKRSSFGIEYSSSSFI